MESIYENPMVGSGRVDTRPGDIEMKSCGDYESVETSTSRQHQEERIENVAPNYNKAEESSKSYSRSAVTTALLATILILNLSISVVSVIYITQHVKDQQSMRIPENSEKNLTSMTSKAHASDQQQGINLENLEKNITSIIEKMHADDHQSKTILENLEKNQKSIMNRLEVISDHGGLLRELAAQNLNMSEELQFLRSRIVGTDTEWSSELRSIKNITYRMEKELNIIDRKLNGLPKSDCSAVSRVWNSSDGVFDISYHGRHFQVYCDSTTDGGGWTVFQRRMDGSVDFYKTWEEYANGFGNKTGEFWLGLENIHQLTQDGAYELRVELTDWDGSTGYAKYGTFSISSRADNYRLTAGEYSGTAEDSLSHSNGAPFSAKDKDFEGWAVNRVTAWWFKSGATSSLNGRYNDTSTVGSGIFWYYWKRRSPYSLKASEMKFRKK